MAECNFEKDLDKLEQIVSALEEGGLSLDDSLKQFEQGIKLARRCERTLSEAEKRIEVLVKKANGEIVAEPFDEEGETDGKARKTESAEKRRAAKPEGNGNGEDDEEDEGTLLF